MPRQRRYCPGKTQDVKHPDMSARGPLSLCIYTSKGTQRASGIFSPISNSASYWAGKRRDQCSWGPAKCLVLDPLSRSPQNPERNIVATPTLQVRNFGHTEVRDSARPSQLLNGRCDLGPC